MSNFSYSFFTQNKVKKISRFLTVSAVIVLLLGGSLFPQQAVAADTTPPVISSTFPMTGSTGIPIGMTVHVNFNELVDSTTLTPTNITFKKTSDSSAVPFSLRVFPDGFDVVPSVAPTYTASSRFSKLFNVTSGLYNIASAQTIITPLTGYISPTTGDIVFFQRETFPMEVGVVTNNTLTGGTFTVNNFPLFGAQQLVKFGTIVDTAAVTSGVVSMTVGDIVVANTSANPTSDRYAWHVVTTGAVVNNAAFRLDGSAAAPTYVSGSLISAVSPTDTSAINGSNQVGGATDPINLAVGDLVFGKATANADNLNTFAWHIVTTAENFSTDAAPSALRLDGKDTAPTFAASTRISSFTPAAQGAVSDASPTLNGGDIVFSSITAGGANLSAYNFHLVSGSGAPNATTLRFDNISSNLLTATGYTLTVGTGVTDVAGNAFAASQNITFTTASTGTTNTTPAFVVSSSPSQGNQAFPTAAPIKLVFSQDMSTTGGTSGANSVTNASNTGLFTSNFGAPGSVVTATRGYDSASKTLTITPSAALTASTSYIVKVANTTQSAAGTAAQEYFLQFKTASGVDATKPKVLGVFPNAGAASVALPVSDISIGFSEDIDPSSVTGSTITVTPTLANVVTYDAGTRTAHVSPTAALSTGIPYTFTVGTGVTDLSANALEGNGGVFNAVNTTTGVASSYVFRFTTAGTTDSTTPTVVSGNADNFSVAVTFSEGMKTGGGPSAADNIANYTVESPVGAAVSLSGKTVTYNGANQTATITGLALQNGSPFKVTVSSAVQDIAGNLITTSGTPAANTAQATVQNATTTGGQLGPGGGTAQDPGQFGMTPIRVTPMNRSAGATSNYSVEFPVSTTIPVGGTIVLTFPVGFDVTNAAAATATTESFRNSDLNGPLAGTVTIGSLTASAGARTVTITTAGAATGASAFISFDLKSIANTTVPSSSGYTVDIKTKNDSGVQLESLTSASFFLGQAGTNTLTVNVFNDNGAGGGTANNNTKDGTEAAVADATIYLFSPGSGGQSATSNGSGVATFSNLLSGSDYMVGIESSSVAGGNFITNPAPQSLSISGNTTKNFGLTASTISIQGTITGPASTSIDVGASSTTGSFITRTYTIGGGGTVAYSIPAASNTTYSVGVYPAIPKTSLQPGAPPPPPPSFNFMPPPPLTVKVLEANVTGQDITLSSTSKTITGSVIDSSSSGISGAMVFARPVSSSTTGGGLDNGFGTGGQTSSTGAFTLNVVPGTYLVGVAKPGMPHSEDQQITVPTTGTNSPATLTFKFSANTSLSISGKVTDDSGNTIPYAGVSGRKVTSTSNTTPLGGGSDAFVGGPTDANGAYTLYVSNGTWVIEAFAPGFGKLGTKTVTMAGSNLTGQDFSAATLSVGTIKGQATKASVAQQGVMVRAEGTAGGNMTMTDSAGNYILKVPAGTYTVTCMFPGIGESTPLTGVTVTASTDTTGKNCTLAAPITVTVNLTNGTSAITNAFVDARDSNGRGSGTGTSSTSGANGVYVLTLPPGTYTVRAGHPAYGEIGSTSSVNSTRTITYTATSGNTYAVTGTVNASGSALSNAWVSLTGTSTGQTRIIHLGAQTGSDGTFSISVPSGSYKLRVDKPGYKTPTESTVTVSGANVATGTTVLTVASRTITGTVTLNGTAVSNTFVDASDGNGGYAVAQTGTDGAYSLAVDNGSWTIYAHSQGYEGGPIFVTVSNDNPTGKTVTVSAISGFTMKADTLESITPSSGGYVTNSNIGSAFKLNIPANALGTGSNASTLTTNVNTGMPNPPTGSILKTNSVSITAVDSSGQPIKSLNSAVTITVPYDESALPSGASESNLVLGVWNTATQSYDTLSTTVDTTANTLTATVDHFSDFAPLVPTDPTAPATPANLNVTQPNVSTSAFVSWSLVSGAATYNIYRSTDNSSFPLLISVSTNSYTNTDLTVGTTYYYKVTAVSSAGAESAATSAASYTPTSTTGSGPSSGGASPAPAPAPSPTPAAASGAGPAATAPAPAPAPAPTPTPAPVSAQALSPIPTLPANPTVADIQAVIAVILSNIEILKAQLAQITAAEGAKVQGVPAVCQGVTLKRALTVNIVGNDVKCMQMLLNQSDDTKIASTGSGARGNETTFFGKLTEAAVGRFQLKYGLVANANDPAYGYVGPKTRVKMNELLTGK